MNDQIVINPPDSLEDGQQVNLASTKEGSPQNPASQQQKSRSPQEEENAPLQPSGEKGSGH